MAKAGAFKHASAIAATTKRRILISDLVTDVTFPIPRGQRGEQRRKAETSSPRLTHDLLLIVAMLCLLQDSSETARGVGRSETRQKDSRW